jgi:hypothetical protein
MAKRSNCSLGSSRSAQRATRLIRNRRRGQHEENQDNRSGQVADHAETEKQPMSSDVLAVAVAFPWTKSLVGM